MSENLIDLFKQHGKQISIQPSEHFSIVGRESVIYIEKGDIDLFLQKKSENSHHALHTLWRVLPGQIVFSVNTDSLNKEWDIISHPGINTIGFELPLSVLLKNIFTHSNLYNQFLLLLDVFLTQSTYSLKSTHLQELLPEKNNKNSEAWKKILSDIQQIIFNLHIDVIQSYAKTNIPNHPLLKEFHG